MISFACRRFSKKWYPTSYVVIITDDRRNEYKAGLFAGVGLHVVGSAGASCSVALSLPVGFTWSTGPVTVSIPRIAPISKIELEQQNIPALEGPKKATLDLKKVFFLDLDFKIKPEHLLLHKEIKMGKHLSMLLGEPDVKEEEAVFKSHYGDPGKKVKRISVNIPLTVKNFDYNPHTGEEEVANL